MTAPAPTRRIDLDVPEGTELRLLPGDWLPTDGEHASGSPVVTVVAVGRYAHRGDWVLVQGHVCRRRYPDCDRHHCWEARVRPAAIRAHLAGVR
ncbi:hypothetical protein [Verrucosispora sp. TAA-831]|uniref:hypothetical protein n=1 Tax=Verrucosispora sp. TAA-831 TaxID=3422227 RepID=UPI003D6ECF15